MQTHFETLREALGRVRATAQSGEEVADNLRKEIQALSAEKKQRERNLLLELEMQQKVESDLRQELEEVNAANAEVLEQVRAELEQLRAERDSMESGFQQNELEKKRAAAEIDQLRKLREATQLQETEQKNQLRAQLTEMRAERDELVLAQAETGKALEKLERQLNQLHEVSVVNNLI